MNYKLKKESINFLKRAIGFNYNSKSSILVYNISPQKLIQNILNKKVSTLKRVLTDVIIKLTHNKPSLIAITATN